MINCVAVSSLSYIFYKILNRHSHSMDHKEDHVFEPFIWVNGFLSPSFSLFTRFRLFNVMFSSLFVLPILMHHYSFESFSLLAYLLSNYTTFFTTSISHFRYFLII